MHAATAERPPESVLPRLRPFILQLALVVDNMGLADLFSSIVSTVYADAPEEKEEKAASAEEPTEEPTEEPAEEPAAEAEEEEEPEDVRPVVRSDASVPLLTAF